MNHLERIEKLAHIRARIQMCSELNQFLDENRGFFGFISWWKVNELVKRWIRENNQLIKGE